MKPPVLGWVRGTSPHPLAAIGSDHHRSETRPYPVSYTWGTLSLLQADNKKQEKPISEESRLPGASGQSY
jgi:hypothetical protein